MAFLSETDRAAVTERLEAQMVNPIRVVVLSEPSFGLFVPGRRQCASCSETEALMKEVAELSDKIELEIINVRESSLVAEEWGVSFTPTIAITTDGAAGARVRFLGIPAGYEFSSFLETVLSASSDNGSGLGADSLEQLASLQEDVEIKTFVTPT